MYLDIISIVTKHTLLLFLSLFAASKTHNIFDWVYQQEMEKQKTYLEEIQASLKIALPPWNQFLQTFEKLKSDDTLLQLPSDKNIYKKRLGFINRVKSIMFDAGINPERVKLQEVTTGTAQALQWCDEHGVHHILEINTDWFKQIPDVEQEAVLIHELMHLYNYDCLQEALLRFLLQTYDKSEIDLNPAIIAYRQHREMRADLLACCKNKVIAQALARRHAHEAKKYNQDNPKQWLTHPSHVTRIAHINEFLKQNNHIWS